MFSKDCVEAIEFFSAWHENYKAGVKEGVIQDQPSLSKTNYESNCIIKELSGEWNCQIRLGAKYLKNLKILHLVSKRNMPISILGDKKFLQKLKQEGLTEENKLLIIDIGHFSTKIECLFKGFPNNESKFEFPIGGYHITQNLGSIN